MELSFRKSGDTGHGAFGVTDLCELRKAEETATFFFFFLLNLT